MAQRKTPNNAAKKPGSRPATGSRPPVRKPGKSIVNQKQTPWGLIITTVVLVLFAGAIVLYAVTRSSDTNGNASDSKVSAADKPWVRPEIAAAKKINGLTYKKEIKHSHVKGTVKYDTSPPIGGDHSGVWADCQGKVYDHQIANENAVHMLEHGAVWITYNPKTATAPDVKKLQSLVDGVDRMALSPYAGLKTPISLQSWNYQLFVSQATDPRISAFIEALRYNPDTTPEQAGCASPNFDASKSTPGHPLEG